MEGPGETMRIIGVCGSAGSGKSAVADILARECGFVVIALADPLKRFCAEAWGWDRATLWGSSHRRNEPDTRYRMASGEFLTPRRALQVLGTEFGRTMDPDVWVRLAIQMAARVGAGANYAPEIGLTNWLFPIHETYNGVVIPDVRFRNEVDAINRAGGKVWKVVRDGAGLEGEAGLHASEQELVRIPGSEFAAALDNNGTLEELRANVLGLVRE
jgi:hypothetical protein